MGQVLIKGVQCVEAATGHQASDRDRQRKERKRSRWGRMEHIARKLDLGNTNSAACDPVHLCQIHIFGKCEHISDTLVICCACE